MAANQRLICATTKALRIGLHRNVGNYQETLVLNLPSEVTKRMEESDVESTLATQAFNHVGGTHNIKAPT
jgi:hypothetical protein